MSTPRSTVRLDSDLPRSRRELLEQLDEIDHGFYAVWRARTPEERGRRPDERSWSIAEIVEHVLETDRGYLAAMREAVERRPPGPDPDPDGPFRATFLERAFLALLEPPARLRMPAPGKILPRSERPPEEVWSAYQHLHGEVRDWIRTTADLDLGAVRFPNPFVRGVRFRVGSGLRILLAHGRRHLAQARKTGARIAMEGAANP